MLKMVVKKTLVVIKEESVIQRSVLVFFLFSLNAFASTGAVECLKKAYALDKPSLNSSEAVTLCSGAKSEAPVTCITAAYAMDKPSLNSSEAIAICSGTASNAPLDCAKAAYELTRPALNNSEIIRLCRIRYSN
jgi:hypothetical protein